MKPFSKISPPIAAIHQTFKPGPFRTPVRANDDCDPATKPTVKRAPSPAILIGEAGANLVQSRLQTWGIATQAAMPGVPYDLVADLPEFDLVRIQVKTKAKLCHKTCRFSLTRGQYYSPRGMFKYAVDDFDIAAFAILSIGKVFFCAAPIHRINVRAEWLCIPQIDQETFKIALNTLERRRRLEALSWLSLMTKDGSNDTDSSDDDKDSSNDDQQDFNF